MSKPVPKPWIDALPAGDPLREALLAARAEVPGRARLERVYGSVVAAGGGPGGGPGGGGGGSEGGGDAPGGGEVPAGQGAATLGTSTLGKLLGIGLVGAASIATAVWIVGPASSAGAPGARTPSAGVVGEDRRAVDAVVLEPASSSAVVEPRVVASAATAPAAPPSTGVSAADASGADDPDAEMALLREAQAAAASAPARALDLLDASERRFPRSALAQERAVIRVQALLAAGRRDEALSHARALIAANPGTAHRPRLEQLLPELAD